MNRREEKRGIVGCSREEEEEVVIELEVMVKLIKVELAYYTSIFQGFKICMSLCMSCVLEIKISWPFTRVSSMKD